MSTHWDNFHFSPQSFLGWALQSGWRPGVLPVGVIYTFQPGVRRYLEEHPDRFAPNQDLTVSNAAMYMTVDEGAPVMIGSLNPGGASLATQLEHLRFLGDNTRYVAVVGTAGGLVAGHHLADTVVVEAALRDEAISDRYLPAARTVNADPEFTAALLTTLGSPKPPVKTWTVAVPYRQTHEDLLAARSDGAEVVEMEIATLFAVAEALEMQAAAAVVISDVSNADGWTSDWSDTGAPTNAAVEAVISTMRALSES